MLCVQEARQESERVSEIIFESTRQTILLDLCRIIVADYLDVEFLAFELSLLRNHGIYDGYFYDHQDYKHIHIRDALFNELQEGSSHCPLLDRFMTRLRSAQDTLIFHSDLKVTLIHTLRFSMRLDGAITRCHRMPCYYTKCCSCESPVMIRDLIEYRKRHKILPDIIFGDDLFAPSTS